MYTSKTTAKHTIRLMNEVMRYKVHYSKAKDLLIANNNLSERQIKILITLFINDKNIVSEMAKSMNISKSTLSIILSKLIKKGLVYKEFPNEIDDKRRIYFKITDEGLEQLKLFSKVSMEHFENVYNSFSEEGRKNLIEGINKLTLSQNSSVKGFYKFVMNSNYNKIQGTSEIEKLAFKLYMFFISFAEYYEGVLRDKTYGSSDILRSLTRNRYIILHCLKYLKLNTVSKLEEHLNASGSSISIAISRLAKDGLIYKTYPKDGEDGRIVYIHLSELGLKIVEDAGKNMLTALETYFDAFSEKERQDVIDASKKILAAFKSVSN